MAKEEEPFLRVGDWSSSDVVAPGRTAMPEGGAGSNVPDVTPPASPAKGEIPPPLTGFQSAQLQKNIEGRFGKKAQEAAAPAAGTPALPQLGPPQPKSDLAFSADKPLLTNIGRTPTVMGGENWVSPAPGVPKGFASQADYDAYNAKNPVGGALDLRPGTRGYMEKTGLRPSMGGQIPGAAGPAFMADENGRMVTDYPESVKYALPVGGNRTPSIGDQTRAILSDKGPADVSRVQQILNGFRGSVQDLGGSGGSSGSSGESDRTRRMREEDEAYGGRGGFRNSFDKFDGLRGPNGRISRSMVRLREQGMQDAAAGRRQTQQQDASMRQALTLKGLDIASQGDLNDMGTQRALELEGFRQEGEEGRQGRDIASREKIAGMGISEREAAAERRATSAEAINAARIGAGQYDRGKGFDPTSAAKVIQEDYMNQIPGGTPEGKMEYLRRQHGGDTGAGTGQRTVKRSGKDKSGRSVVEYSDGSIEYAK